MNTAAPQTDILNMVLALIFVIGLIFACAWIARRLNGGFRLPQKQTRVVSVTPLGGKEKLVVVEVENQKLLLGVSPGSVNLVKDLGPVSVPGPDSGETDSEEPMTFSDRLKLVLKGSEQWSNTSGQNFKDT